MNDMERLIATALHSGNKFMDYGTVTGTSITFAHKFVSIPVIVLTPLADSGSPVATVVSKDQDANGYYVGATIVMTDATSVDWVAIGTGISA